MFAAVLHASWNAILKRGEDKRLQMTAIAVGHLPFAPIAIYFAPSLAPKEPLPNKIVLPAISEKFFTPDFFDITKCIVKEGIGNKALMFL